MIDYFINIIFPYLKGKELIIELPATCYSETGIDDINKLGIREENGEIAYVAYHTDGRVTISRGDIDLFLVRKRCGDYRLMKALMKSIDKDWDKWADLISMLMGEFPLLFIFMDGISNV